MLGIMNRFNFYTFSGMLVVLVNTSNLKSQTLRSDFDKDGCVTTSDLNVVLSEFGACEPAPLDIVPLFNNEFHVETENSFLIGYPMIQNSNVDFDDVQNTVAYSWRLGDTVLSTDRDLNLIEAKKRGLCSGTSAITYTIAHNGFVYERTVVSTVVYDSEKGVESCNVGLDMPTLEELYNGFVPWPSYKFCRNCEK